MFNNLNKEAKRELLIVITSAIVLVMCWSIYNIYKKNKESVRMAECIDACTRKEIYQMIKSNVLDKEIHARVPSLEKFCKKKCN